MRYIYNISYIRHVDKHFCKFMQTKDSPNTGMYCCILPIKDKHQKKIRVVKCNVVVFSPNFDLRIRTNRIVKYQKATPLFFNDNWVNVTTRRANSSITWEWWTEKTSFKRYNGSSKASLRGKFTKVFCWRW